MAYRLSILIVLFLLFFNGGAVFLDNTGAGDYMGIDTSVGDTSALETAEETTSFQTGSGTGSTLFGTYNRLTSFFNTLFNSIMPGAAMLKNAWPNPDWALAVNFVFTGIAIIPVIDAAKFFRGL